MNRRDLIKAAMGSAALTPLVHGAGEAAQRRDVSLQNFKTISGKSLRIADGVSLLKKGEKGNTPPTLREEVLDNPGAVFVVLADIETERDERGVWKPCPGQIERFGRRVGGLVFRKGAGTGGRTFIKPNMVSGFRGGTLVGDSHGGMVHPYFTVGLVDILHGLGNSNTAAGARGGMTNEQFRQSGCKDLFDRHGLPLIEENMQPFKLYRKSELVEHDCPDGMVNRRFFTCKPAFLDYTFFINIAHAHTHKVGHTTLTIKNLQGIMPRGYGHICDSWTSMDIWRREFRKDFNPDYRRAVEQSWLRHAGMGYKFWDEGGFYRSYRSAGGYVAFSTALRAYEKSRGDERKLNMERLYDIADSRLFWAEQWAQRMMDIVEVLPPPDLNMVEGIFARGHNTGIMHTNFVVLGRSMVAVDAVASWMMGHDPREIPYLRIANERGLGSNDIESIPLFFLDEKGPGRIGDIRRLPRYFLGIYNYGLKEPGPRFF
ncbi:MAG: DUF362 domain-containing protein [Candidatus Latescibacteria bacterium]|nr:DUF362 domain-containing protein [Candidatus Latescibacterota bacterium]